MAKLDKTLKERGGRYGSFKESGTNINTTLLTLRKS